VGGTKQGAEGVREGEKARTRGQGDSDNGTTGCRGCEGSGGSEREQPGSYRRCGAISKIAGTRAEAPRGSSFAERVERSAVGPAKKKGGAPQRPV